MAEPEYELFAIRYATRDAHRSEHFIGSGLRARACLNLPIKQAAPPDLSV